MFKRIIDGKKFEGKGEPAAAGELRDALKTFFPQTGEINKYLRFESNEKLHEGFAAVWEYYGIDTDSDGDRRKHLITYTINVDIRPEEKAVYIKTKSVMRTKRPPRDTEVLDPWFIGVGIGDPTTILEEYSKFVKVFQPKKKLRMLVEKANSLGWDAYL
jgi:hypothetical protein